jgi:hypothetical protein
VSVPPPAPDVTTNSTGFVGFHSAWAAVAPKITAHTAAAIDILLFIVSSPSDVVLSRLA